VATSLCTNASCARRPRGHPRCQQIRRSSPRRPRGLVPAAWRRWRDQAVDTSRSRLPWPARSGRVRCRIQGHLARLRRESCCNGDGRRNRAPHRGPPPRVRHREDGPFILGQAVATHDGPAPPTSGWVHAGPRRNRPITSCAVKVVQGRASHVDLAKDCVCRARPGVGSGPVPTTGCGIHLRWAAVKQGHGRSEMTDDIGQSRSPRAGTSTCLGLALGLPPAKIGPLACWRELLKRNLRVDVALRGARPHRVAADKPTSPLASCSHRGFEERGGLNPAASRLRADTVTAESQWSESTAAPPVGAGVLRCQQRNSSTVALSPWLAVITMRRNWRPTGKPRADSLLAPLGNQTSSPLGK